MQHPQGRGANGTPFYTSSQRTLLTQGFVYAGARLMEEWEEEGEVTCRGYEDGTVDMIMSDLLIVRVRNEDTPCEVAETVNAAREQRPEGLAVGAEAAGPGADDFDPTHDLGTALGLEIVSRDIDDLTETFVDVRGRRYRLPEGVAERRTRLPRPGEVWHGLMGDYEWVDPQGRLIGYKRGTVDWSPGDAHLDEYERVTPRFRNLDGSAPPVGPPAETTAR